MLKISNYQIFCHGKKIHFFDSKKNLSLIDNKLFYMEQLTKKLSPVAHYCNSSKSKTLLQKAISKKIINENCLIITHNQDPPKNSQNHRELSSNLCLKNIKNICCWSKFKNDETVDEIYQIIAKSNLKILIHDEILFTEQEQSASHKYRGIKYFQNDESHLPSHFTNDAYIEELHKIIAKFKHPISHMDICAGQGSIGFSLFSENKKLKKLFSVEINPTYVTQMKKTLQKIKFLQKILK